MMAYLKRAFEEGTQITRFNLMTAASVGSSAHFLFFFLFKYHFGLAENVYLRMLCVALCLSIFFLDRLPKAVLRYLPYYWHACLIFILPFIFTYNLLITDFHELWRYWAIFMVSVTVTYVPNLLMILVDLIVGILLAIGYFVLTTPKVDLHPDFNVPLFTIVVVFTVFSMYLFSHNTLLGVVAKERLKQDALRALAASIAHEMRNPLGQLNISLGAIARLLPAYSPSQPPGPMGERDLEEIYRLVAHGQMAAQRGRQVIDMILNEVRDRPIDAAGFTTLSAAQATRRAVEEYGYESPAERARVRLRLDHDFSFRGDETLLVFVLFNLLKNALYYLRGRPDGRIDIALESGPGGNRLRFRDSGPGIAPEELSHLFDAFYTRGKEGGTGVGLSYCKRVMRAFGGDIRCASEPGVFTEFTLSFPPSAATEAARAPGPDRHFEGKRLLVVDDDPLQRDASSRLLRSLGAEVAEAENGREALARLAEGHFQLVLMDLNMPLMNGYEAAEAIRAGAAGEEARTVPIVACSSEPEYIARGKTEKVGMQGLLAKPCGEAQLLRELSLLLGPHSPGAMLKVRSAFAAPGNAGGATLLLVDDAETMLHTMALFYRGRGFEVLQAGSGREALQVLERFRCDLVLTDLGMPAMDGCELARRIRAHDDPAIAALPIIGLSGYGDDRHREEALAAGMSRYLDKGTDLDTLVQTIRLLLPAAAPEEAPPGGLDPGRIAAVLRIPREEVGGHLARFAAEFRDYPRRLREASATGEREELRRLAHKLTGTARLLRIGEVEEGARAVEAGDAEAVEPLVATLEAVVGYIDAMGGRRALVGAGR